MSTMTISDKLKELRLKFGLKQTDLANSLRVTPQAVSKWERGQNFPDLFLIKKIAGLFDVSTDYLLGMHEEAKDVFEATVFSSSVNHFAEKGKRLTAKELALWTNGVFHSMTEAALKHGGVPVKYTGDGFLCFFSGMGHRDRAVRAATDVDRVHTDKETVIFLHAGEIYFGLAGHPDYASRDIYGDTVNETFLMRDSFAKKVKRGVGISDAVKKSLKNETPGDYHVYKEDGR
jgi:transcriptional regulator with XRE-family HTH domain